MNQSQTVSIKDIIKKSFLESGLFNNANNAELAITIISSLLFSLLMGLFIYYIYKKTFRGVVFSQSFAITIVGMCVLTCMVTLAISTNVVLSLGMVGALSIVRFRTAIKEPMDLLFLFWSITTGIASGAGAYLLVIAASVIILLMLILLNYRNLGHGIYVMIVHYTGDDINDEIKKVMNTTKYQIKSKTMRGNNSEMAIEVSVKNNNLAFAERIRDLERVSDLTIIQYNGDYNG